MSLVETLSLLLEERSLMMASAESCTGGMIAAAMTDRAGSSAVFERGFVTYSNESKIELLCVPAETIDTHGAVSPETAEAMVNGALNNSRAGIAVSVTGIAGPGGGSAGKPVGLVYIGIGLRGSPVIVTENHFSGTRNDVRQQTVEAALKQLIKQLKDTQ